MLGLIVILRVGQRLKVGKSDGARLESEHADEPCFGTIYSHECPRTQRIRSETLRNVSIDILSIVLISGLHPTRRIRNNSTGDANVSSGRS